MIVEYSVAHAIYDNAIATVQHEKKLEDEVNHMIKKGWQPHGSLVVSQKDGTVVFVQPMVRTEAALSGVGAGVLRHIVENVR